MADCDADGSHQFQGGLAQSFEASFGAAIHSLLTSCTRSEVLSHFSKFQPDVQNYIYKLYALVIAQVHENMKAEFKSICTESKVMEVLDYFDKTVLLRASEARDRATAQLTFQEASIKSKLIALDNLKEQMLLQAEMNCLFASQLHKLHQNTDICRDLSAMDALISEVKDVNLKVAEIVGRSSID